MYGIIFHHPVFANDVVWKYGVAFISDRARYVDPGRLDQSVMTISKLCIEKNRTKIKPDVDGLIKNVPYRLLSSFASEISGDDRIWDQKKRLIAYIELLNETQYLPYIIIDGRGASRKIRRARASRQLS